MYVLLIWGPVYLIRVHGFETGVLGTLLALIIGIVGFAGTLAGGFLADKLAGKYGDRSMLLKLCAMVCALATPLFIAFGIINNSTFALVALSCGWLVGNMWLGPVYSVLQSLSNASSRAIAAAIALFFVNMIGYGLGPLLVGIVSDVLSPVYGDQAIRYAIITIVTLAGVWGTIHFAMAARTYNRDLEIKMIGETT